MKKKLFIGLLPALMTLSACGGISPKASAQESGTFLEDTLAHEELFGSLNDPSSPIKSVRNLNPTDPSVPAIGVQFKEDRDGEEALQYVSVRYVAAVKVEKLSSASAVWTRTVYEADGSVRIASDDVECEKVYTVIQDGAGSLSMDDYNSSLSTDYNYFVTYVIRHIPASDIGGCLCASLTFNDGKNTPTTTRIVATQLNERTNSISAAFDSDDFTDYTTGGSYFLKGSIGAESTARLSADPLPRSGIASFSSSLNLSSGNNFVVAYSDYSDAENPKFKLLNPALDGEKTASGVTKTNGKIAVGTTAQYILCLKNASTLTSEVAHNVVFRATAADIDSSTYSMYAVGSFNDWTANPYYKLNLVDGTWYGTFAIPVGDGHSFKFAKCRTAQVDRLAWMDGYNYDFNVSTTDVTLSVVNITVWKYIINIVLTLTSEPGTAVNIIYDIDKSIDSGDWINPGYGRNPDWNAMGHTSATTVYTYSIQNVNLNQLFRFMFIRWVADGKGYAEMTGYENFKPVSLTITESITIRANGTMPTPVDGNDVTSVISYSID